MTRTAPTAASRSGPSSSAGSPCSRPRPRPGVPAPTPFARGRIRSRRRRKGEPQRRLGVRDGQRDGRGGRRLRVPRNLDAKNRPTPEAISYFRLLGS